MVMANADLRKIFTLDKSNLNIAHVNAESLLAHWEEFQLIFVNSGAHIIGVSETFLKPDISSAAVDLDGYNIVRVDRQGKGRGGVATFVKRSLDYKIVLSSSNVYSNSPEYIFIEVGKNNSKVLIGVVYSPPKANNISLVFLELAKIIGDYESIAVMGDWNINLLSESYSSKYFLRLLETYSLDHLPLSATHFSAFPVAATQIDHIITNNRNAVVKFGQMCAPGLSRHDLIYCSMIYKEAPIKAVTKMIRIPKNVDNKRLVSDAKLVSWIEVYDTKEVDSKVALFTTDIIKLLDVYMPLKKIKEKRPPAPWIDLEIRNLMKDRNKAYKKWTKTQMYNDRLSYNKLRNKVKQKLRNAKHKYYRKLFGMNMKPDTFWKIIKQQGLGKNKIVQIPPSLDLNDLNKHFCGTPTSDDHSEIIAYYENLRRISSNICCIETIEAETVRKSLVNITSGAVGHDGIPVVFLKMIAEVICPVLSHIFTASLNTGEYPTQWKKAVVLPLNKIDKPSDCKDFRGINNLCVLGKMLDRCVYEVVSSYVVENSILDIYQAGFRVGNSTETALISVLDSARRAMDRRKIMILCLIDFARAFDMISYDILLAILRSVGFSRSLVSWFKSLLSDRWQKVRTADGYESDWCKVGVGIPQGSVVSALIFVLFINRISDCLQHCGHMLYADDLQIFIETDVDGFDSAVQNMNADITRLTEWCKTHSMRMNPLKCKVVALGYSRITGKLNFSSVQQVEIGGIQLGFEECVKNLGIMVDCNLSWDEQVIQTCNKIYKGLYQLRRLAFHLPQDVKLKIVQAMLFPILDYCAITYMDMTVEISNKLQVAQNACIRFILKLPIFEHVTPHYQKLGWLKIKEWRKFRVGVLLYKILKNKQPEYLLNKFEYMSNVHSKNTRAAAKMLQVPIHRTVMYAKSFEVVAVQVHNEYMDLFNSGLSISAFKQKLKDKLLQLYND